jgi:hypothetical protein
MQQTQQFALLILVKAFIFALPFIKKSMIKKCLIGLLVLVFTNQLHAQSSIKDSSINIVLIGMGAGIYLPAGNMADSYGTTYCADLSVGLKRKNNWIYSIEGDYLFGSTVKDVYLFRHIVTSDGQIIGDNGKFSEVRTFERGYAITLNVTKIITLGKPNKNSGFLIRGGVGFMQHKIRIETPDNTVPYLDKDYRKGYDKLTNGFALHQFIGYQYLSNKRFVNFFAGFDFYEAFTQNRRSFNYDDLKQDTEKRKDILLGIKVGWILPLYKMAPNAYYY